MPAGTVARHSIVTVMLVLFSTCAFSQSSPTGPKTVPGVPSMSTAPRPRAEQDRRPLSLTGRVALDNGAPPPERVAIERVCSGRVRREGYSDAQGKFSLQLGFDTQMFRDATASGSSDTLRGSEMGESDPTPALNVAPGPSMSGVTTRDLMGCELRGSLAGFRSDSISLAGRQLADHPDVGVIVLHRMGKVEGTRVSVTTMQAPKDAKKAYEGGLDLLKKKKQAEAANELARAVALYPKFADAMVLLAQIRNAEGRSDEAETLFRQAMEADPKLMQPYVDLALIAGRKQDWVRMAELSERALALNPYEYPLVYFFNAVANYHLEKNELAEENARMAQRLDSQHRMPKIDLILANILLRRNDYAGAAEQLRALLKNVPSGSDAEVARKLLADTERKLVAAPAAPQQQK